jgi:hypothetical protein
MDKSQDGSSNKELRKNEMTALSLYQLLGAPLHALIDAETQAAQATADFITRFGFVREDPPDENEQKEEENTTPKRENQLGKLRMASFSHERMGPDGKLRTIKIEVPFLSLLPIPALQIKDAEFDFYIKILDTYPINMKKRPERKPGPPEAGTKNEGEMREISPIDLKATLGRDPGRVDDRRALEVQMRAKIRVEQADVPAGLSKLFHIMEQQITATEE